MGHPVAHSRSPMIHGYWLRTLGIPGAYELKDLMPEQFVPFISDLAGNYTNTVFSMPDVIDDAWWNGVAYLRLSGAPAAVWRSPGS